MSVGLPPDAAPWWQIALIALVGPPVMAYLANWMGRMWSRSVAAAMGTEVSERTERLLAVTLKWSIVAFYALTLGIFGWALFLR